MSSSEQPQESGEKRLEDFRAHVEELKRIEMEKKRAMEERLAQGEGRGDVYNADFDAIDSQFLTARDRQAYESLDLLDSSSFTSLRNERFREFPQDRKNSDDIEYTALQYFWSFMAHELMAIESKRRRYAQERGVGK